MPRGRVRDGLLLAMSTMAFAAAAQAGETVTYTYDALGRLTATSTTGSVNNGVSTAVGYDPAGNRSSYAVEGGEGPAAPQANLRPVPGGVYGEGHSCESMKFDAVASGREADGGGGTATAVSGDPGFSALTRATILYADRGQVGPSSAAYVSSDSGSTWALIYSDMPRDFCP